MELTSTKKGFTKQAYYMVAIVIVSCILMAMVETLIIPNYLIKSLMKIVLFLSLPFVFAICNKGVSFKSLFKFTKKGILISLVLGVSVYALIMIVYFLLSPYFDLTNITASLEKSLGVQKENFLFVAIYISFINSLLEEFFFRGFAFILLMKQSNKIFAYVFSSIAFSLYHIAMMTNWFSILLYVLIIVALFIAGMIFNKLNEKNENIYSSWMVHMFANFAINTIGLILFGII